MFCDMKTRVLYPACNATTQTHCFDPVLNETRTDVVDEEVKKRGEQSMYIEVKEWL
jgi:hypothetical protein